MADSLRAFLAEEPYTLAMSSGFFGFYAHAGMLAALVEAGLPPAAFAGSSAGALVGGLAASGLRPADIVRSLEALDRATFWDPSLGAGLLRGDRFRAHLTSMAGATTIEGCACPLVVSTFDLTKRATHVLDRGPLVPAIYASCAVPLLFQPIRHQGRWLADGGIADRPGIMGLPSGIRLLHHHLSSRSPWRLPGSRALLVESRPNAVTLVIDDLPRAGPFALDAGRRALALARERTHALLDAPLADGIVRGRAEAQTGASDQRG